MSIIPTKSNARGVATIQSAISVIQTSAAPKIVPADVKISLIKKPPIYFIICFKRLKKRKHTPKINKEKENKAKGVAIIQLKNEEPQSNKLSSKIDI